MSKLDEAIALARSALRRQAAGDFREALQQAADALELAPDSKTIQGIHERANEAYERAEAIADERRASCTR